MTEIKVPLSKPSIDYEEIEAIRHVCASGCLAGTCEEVRIFEKEFADFVGSKYAVATSNCTTALHLACLALGVTRKSRVVVPTYTFPATANAPLYCGADVDIVDVDSDTFNIDIDNVKTGFWGRDPDVLIPVHCFGNPADMPAIMDFADDHGSAVIEDAACAMPAYIGGYHAGTIGDVGCYSFYAIKNLCTGEGGMLVTDDEEIYETARALSDFGKTTSKPLPSFTMLGYNYRLSALQAAMGRVQLRKIPEMHKKRQEIARFYNKYLFDELYEYVYPQLVVVDRVSAYQRYAVVMKDNWNRQSIIAELENRGIQTTIGTFDLSSQPYYKDLCKERPVGKMLFNQSISLPMYPDLGLENAQLVCDALTAVFKGK